jgi:hypothetical protein
VQGVSGPPESCCCCTRPGHYQDCGGNLDDPGHAPGLALHHEGDTASSHMHCVIWQKTPSSRRGSISVVCKDIGSYRFASRPAHIVHGMYAATFCSTHSTPWHSAAHCSTEIHGKLLRHLAIHLLYNVSVHGAGQRHPERLVNGIYELTGDFVIVPSD